MKNSSFIAHVSTSVGRPYYDDTLSTHFAAFFEIYKNIIPLHRSQFKILANFRRKVFAIFKISSKILIFFTIFIGFCTDFDEIFSEFRQIP